MSQPTTGVYFNKTAPPPPPGNQNVTFQSDGAVPQQSITACPQIATDDLVGVVRPDGVTLQVDETGEISVINPGTGEGGGTTAGTGTGFGPPVVPSGAKDGSNTSYTLPAPPIAGTGYLYVRDGVVQRQLGTSAEFAVQGTQLTALHPLQSDDWHEFYYSQGTPNSESGGGGSVNPVGAPVIRGSAITASASASSLTLAFPSGTQAGDLAVLFFCGDFTPSTPSGWTNLYLNASLTLRGIAASKVLTSGDISTGSVTVGMGGTQDCVLGVVTFIGGAGGVRETEGQGGSGAPLILTNTTTGAVLTTDVALYFAASRSPSLFPTITPASGSANTLQTSTGTNVDAVMADQAMPGGSLAVANNVSSGGAAQAIQVIVMAP